MGGSAGGLLMGAVVNQSPDLFLGIIMAVPFVDSLTTNLDHSLPLTVGEFDEFGNAKDIIIAGSAVLDKSLSEFAMNNNLSGFEFLSCIPGTIGGGIKMNAGCFGKEFKDILLSIQAIDKTGNVITVPSKDINFEYRKNDLSDDLIFLSASFKGIKSNKAEINHKINKLKTEKEKNQPTKIKTSGSTFKNPISQTDKKVWELIKESVPLNKSFGDACISEKHYNFFVNKGDAKFEDMKKLIDFVAKNVLEKTGISLEKEINEFIDEQHFTQPLPRYSEASLVKKLEELGIGRPSTYASIISVI